MILQDATRQGHKAVIKLLVKHGGQMTGQDGRLAAPHPGHLPSGKVPFPNHGQHQHGAKHCSFLCICAGQMIGWEREVLRGPVCRVAWTSSKSQRDQEKICFRKERLKKAPLRQANHTVPGSLASWVTAACMPLTDCQVQLQGAQCLPLWSTRGTIVWLRLRGCLEKN